MPPQMLAGERLRSLAAALDARSLRFLVPEGQPQLGAEDELAALADIQVLVHHLGDPQVTKRIAGGGHRGGRGVFPGPKLVPMTSMTRYTLMASSLIPVMYVTRARRGR